MSPRPNIFALCCLLPLLAGRLAAAPVLPAAAAGITNDKLTDALLIKQGFTNATVQVIVCLTPPTALKQANFAAADSRAAARPAVKQLQQDVLAALPAADVKAGHHFDNIAGFVADVTPAGLKALQAHAQVVSIEPVIQLQPHLAQGIPLIGGMTYRSTYNGAGLAIAICDTGVDYTHAKLGGGGFPNTKVIGGYDYGDNDANPMPDSTQAHGTCCAGIAAGDLGTVGDYIGGVAYNAKLYALKITSGTSGSASSAAMASAWDWCVTHQNDDPANPIMVISTSFGGGQYFSTCDSTTPSMTTAANNAVAAGITVFASSGNDGFCDSLAWPACISSVISVGAVYDANFGTYTPCVGSGSCANKIATTGCTSGYYVNDATAADKVTAYANVASFLTLFAPGNDCYTLDIAGTGGYSTGDYYANFGGTSAACPYAAGAAACLQSAAKALTGSYLSPAEVKNRLLTYGNNVTDTKVAITKPRINLAAAILSINTNPTPVLNFVSATLAGGNGNQSVDPNECNNLNVVVRNDGNGPATNVTATLTTTSSGVTITQPNSAYSNLAAGASATNLTAFTLSTAPAFVCGTTVNLTLTLNYGGGAATNAFTLGSGGTNYTITPSAGASIVPGTTDVGNHGDDVVTAIALPFGYSFYGQTFSTATVDSNGNLQFTSGTSVYNNACLPSASANNAIFAHWDDLMTSGTNTALGTQGIYTSTSGTTPNRIFNIEWRASYYSATSGGSPLNFEVRLYEGQQRFDLIYGALNGTGASATVGAQKDTGSATAQFSCNTAALSNGLQLTFQSGCVDGGGECNSTNLTANFTAAPTAGLAPLAVAFANTSANATNYSWDFGDGKTSSATNAANTYTNTGSYTVTLTAVGAGGTNALTRTNYIVVTNIPPPVANFTGTPVSGPPPLAVTFANTSSYATNYSWNFGDGKTSTATNPANTYTNAGSYTVTLTAIGASGTNALTRANYIVVTNAAPVITAQPQNVVTNLGSNATFTVTGTGTPPPGYQWRFNGTNIPAATAANYTRINAHLADIGAYSVVVSNVAGSVTSSPANLMVVVTPGVISITGVPFTENFDGMGSSGTTTPFGWYVGTGTAAIAGTTVTVGTGSSSTAGNYNFGSSGATDRALGSLAGGSTQRDTEARFVNLSGLFIAALTISYTGEQWRVGGTAAVNNDLILQYSTDGVNFTALGAAFNFSTPIDSGTAAALDGNAPANRVTGIGGTFTPASNITNGGIFYLRWADPKETSSNHGIAVDDLAVTFTLTNPLPVITVPPQSQSANLGSNVTFTVTATGLAPLAYQWRLNSTNISSATNTVLALVNVQPTNAGNYSVVVANGGGAVTSAVATLTVNLPPLANFTDAPTNGLAPLLVAFTNLSANATNYVWDFGDGKTSAATSPANTYTTAGSYTVTLTAMGAGGTNVLVRTNLIVVTNLPPSLLVVTPALVDFGLVVTGATAQAVFVISNGGGATLTGTATGAGTPFSIVSGDAFSLAATATTNLVVRFAPETPGVFSSQIIFASNGGGTTNAVAGRSSGPIKLLSLPLNGESFQFSFLSVSGLTYEVRYKDTLQDTNWQLWQTVAGDGTIQTLTNPVPAVSQRFFRLRVP